VFFCVLSSEKKDAGRTFYWFAVIVSIFYLYGAVKNTYGIMQAEGFTDLGLLFILAIFYTFCSLYFLKNNYALRNYVVPIGMLLYGGINAILGILAYTNESVFSIKFLWVGPGAIVCFTALAVYSLAMIFKRIPFDSELTFKPRYQGALLIGLVGFLWQLTNTELIDSLFYPLGFLFALPGIIPASAFCAQPQYVDYGLLTGCQTVWVLIVNLILWALIGYLVGVMAERKIARAE